MVRVIKKQLTKRTLDMLTELAKKPKPEGGDAAEGAKRSEYELFWSSFGKFLKLGIVEDQANRCAPSRRSPATLSTPGCAVQHGLSVKRRTHACASEYCA